MQTINQLLDKQITKKAQFLHLVTLSLRSRLPTPSAEHCWAGGIRDNTLVVITDSANWVVPIRYQQFELLKQINSDFQKDLKRLKIKVSNPKYRSRAVIPTNLPTLSVLNAQQLTSVAATIDDQELRTALLHLASRAK